MNKMNKKGFTLIEMLVVIAIIAILVAIIIPTVLGSSTKAKAGTDAANLRSVIAEAYINVMSDAKYKFTGSGTGSVSLLSNEAAAETADTTDRGYYTQMECKTDDDYKLVVTIDKENNVNAYFALDGFSPKGNDFDDPKSDSCLTLEELTSMAGGGNVMAD